MPAEQCLIGTWNINASQMVQTVMITTDLNNFEIIWKHKQVNPEPYWVWLFKCSVVPLQVEFGLFASFNEQTNPIFTGL